MTEADFNIIATAIVVVGAIIVGVTEHATRRRLARAAASGSSCRNRFRLRDRRRATRRRSQAGLANHRI
jgi:hypothetical protein